MTATYFITTLRFAAFVLVLSACYVTSPFLGKQAFAASASASPEAKTASQVILLDSVSLPMAEDTTTYEESVTQRAKLAINKLTTKADSLKQQLEQEDTAKAIEILSERDKESLDRTRTAPKKKSEPSVKVTTTSKEKLKTKPAAAEAAIVAPASTEPLLTYYRLESVDPVGEVVIRTTVNDASGEASLMVNETEVIRYRQVLDDKSPSLQAKQAARHLYNHLLKGGPYQAIEVKSDDAKAVAKVVIQQNTLATADAKSSAEAQHGSAFSLAKAWSSQLRQSLGEPEPVVIKEQPSVAIASYSNANGSVGRQAVLSTLSGTASWYGPTFHGRRTASGTRYNMYEMTAAHKSLPFGTKVRVTNQNNGRSCIVKITDRGPFVGTRVIDLSKGAASAIGMLGSGVAKVTLEVLGR